MIKHYDEFHPLQGGKWDPDKSSGPFSILITSKELQQHPLKPKIKAFNFQLITHQENYEKICSFLKEEFKEKIDIYPNSEAKLSSFQENTPLTYPYIAVCYLQPE